MVATSKTCWEILNLSHELASFLQAFGRVTPDILCLQVMDHFESEHVNQFLVKGLQDLDTEALIKTAENALTNAEAREQLVSKLKDRRVELVM